MTTDVPPTRERLLDATVSLMRAKGAAATGTKEILERAGAPRGSFYFHFPDGKDQLVLEALDQAAAQTLGLIEQCLSSPGRLAEQVGAIFDAIAEDLLTHDYGAGCAVAVTTLEAASASEEFQQAVSGAFGTWTSALVDRLRRDGLDEHRATELADITVAMMEGATVLARARLDTAPLGHAATALQRLLDAAANDSAPITP